MRKLMLLVLLFAPIGCSIGHDAVCEFDTLRFMVPAAPDGEVITVNQHNGWKAIQFRANKLVNDGKATKISELMDQLKRKSCDLKLPTASKSKVDAQQLFERHADGVLVMMSAYLCGRCSKNHFRAASGFVITETGEAVTNYHVVEAKDKTLAMMAMTRDGQLHLVKQVLAASKSEDVAIVQLAGKGFHPVTVRPADAPVGAKVRVISHPDHRFYTLTEGIVSRYAKVPYHGKPVKVQTITAPFAKGSSGAPVFDENGNVVGIVSRTTSTYYSVEKGVQKNLQTVFYQCVPVSSLLKLIKSN